MPRHVACLIGVCSISLFTSTSGAQTREQLQGELDELERAGVSEVARDEVERARELLRSASEAQEQGQSTTAQSLLSLVPLQIRLIRELVAAARAEQTADEVESRLLEREHVRAVAREALEQVLERLAALSLVWEDGP